MNLDLKMQVVMSMFTLPRFWDILHNTWCHIPLKDMLVRGLVASAQDDEAYIVLEPWAKGSMHMEENVREECQPKKFLIENITRLNISRNSNDDHVMWFSILYLMIIEEVYILLGMMESM